MGMRGRRALTSLGLVAAMAVAACSSGGGDGAGDSAGDPPAAQSGSQAQAPATGEAFTVAVIGDYPYGAANVPKFDRLIEAVNAEQPAVVLHLGDIGAQVCTDAGVNTSLAALARFTMPVVYTPGDNEWTDCHEAGVDPLQRLTRVRQLFFPTDQSLGRRTITLTRQSPQYPENTRFELGGVTFVAVHWVGSANGTGRSPEGDAEAAARAAAGLEWLRAGFAAAQSGGSKGVVLFFQADPNFDLYRIGIRNVHTELLRTLEREAIQFRRPVLVAHGDTHTFRVDKALVSSAAGRPIENVTRLENFGGDDVHWSRVTVDPDGPELFTFSPGIVAANVLTHQPPG